MGNQQRTMLLADDSKTNRAVLKGIFEDAYTILEAENGLEAIEFLEKESILVVILDLNMPIVDGFGVLEHMQKTPKLSFIPVIVNTAFSQEENELKALGLGAADFITKPLNAEIVRHRVQNAIAHMMYEQEQQKREMDMERMERMKFLLERDHLTGIYNRETFVKKTKEMLYRNEKSHFVLLGFDIDQFKIVNDLFGTHVGDAVLCRMASVLAKIVNKYGCYGRDAGDYFVACIPAERLDIDYLIKSIEREIREVSASYELHIKVGIYEVEDIHLPIEKMIDGAQMAIRSIKGNYLKKSTYFTETMRMQLLDEQEMVAEMKEALARDEFKVFFQPVFDAETNHIVSAEALVRWQHPQKGLLFPGKFIPLFERNGFIIKLDEYVWERVCKWQRKRLDAGMEIIPVSVNVSRMNLFLPELGDVLTFLVKKYQLETYMLKMEITETACIDNQQKVLDALQRLKAKNFTIMMDDFGSGYSSLNLLKDMPLDILKIDMKFVTDIETSQKARTILENVVKMAKQLHMDIVVEGVETQKQMEMLTELGCELIQGFYFSKPIDRESFDKLLLEKNRA